jgi:hypothetical protein
MANISRDLIGWIRLTENLLVCLPAPMAMTDRRPEIFVGRSPTKWIRLNGKSRTYEQCGAACGCSTGALLIRCLMIHVR